MPAIRFEDPFWLNMFFAAEWIVRLAMVVVVPFRRSPEAAKGWLLLIFFQPTVGLVLYLLIGRPKLPGWRARRRTEFVAQSGAIVDRLARGPHIFHPDLGPELEPAVRLAENLGEFSIVAGNAAKVLVDYDALVDGLLGDIEAATDHVHLLFYLFADDATSARVVQAMQRAVGRGVTCRVLADSFGSGRGFRRLKPHLRAAGIAAEETFRLGFVRYRGRIDLRNHRKIAIIDGRVAYTGSQNLVDATFKPGLTYEELNIRLSGPIVLALQAVFVEDWHIETGQLLLDARYFPDPHLVGDVAVQALPSGPGFKRENNQRLIVSLIHAARRRIAITIPYLIPDDALMQALQTAVLRGVDVTLVVPLQRDQLIVCMAQRSYYDELLSAGVRICRYGRRFLHAKHVAIDGAIAWIGSSNFDIRSFALNEEIVVLVYDRAICGELDAQHAVYLQHGEMLELPAWRARSPPLKVAENLARLLSPLL